MCPYQGIARKRDWVSHCKQLGIDPSRVLSINVFPLHGTLVVKTQDGDVDCHLVPDRDKDNELIFRIVKDEPVEEESR